MYCLETTEIIKNIKKHHYKTVLLQLADGLKPQAQTIADHIKQETGAFVFIWAGSCFGGCDIPFGLDQLGIELVVQYGHNRFLKNPKGW